jgi:nucleoid DNA-binding protein
MFEQYISRLLYKYDTVIVPGFGAFVLKYTSSAILHDEQKLTPAAKHVTFDPSIKNNDGILANCISENERIPFFEACGKILAFAEELNKNIAEGKQVKFEKIGIFFKAPDNGISFISDTSINYNIDTFGMEEIVFHPVLRDDEKEKLPKQVYENPRSISEKSRFLKAAIWILAIVIVAGCSTAALLIIKPDFINYIKLHELLQSAKNKNNPVAYKQYDEKKQSVIKKEVIVTDIIKSDTLEAKSKQNIQSATSEQHATVNFYIISASFLIKDNAYNYAQTLRQKGYNSIVIFIQNTGLHVVSYNSYLSQPEAEQALSNIRKENPDAWILKY